MLSKEQRESIEAEYAMYAILNSLSSLCDVETALSVIDEHGFKEYLVDTYKNQQ